MDIYCIIWVCNADVCYQKWIAHLYLWNISLFYVWLVKVNAPHAGTQRRGTVVKTCYEWLIWGGTSGDSWYTAALWHTDERDCMGDGCLVAERGFMTAAVKLYEKSSIPHTQHLLSESYISSHWASDLQGEPSSPLVHPISLPPALLFSFSTSHSLFLCHMLCTPLALLPWQPWVKSQHVEKQKWGFDCVSLGKRDGVSIIIVFGAAWGIFWLCRCKVAGGFTVLSMYRDLDHIILSVFFL